MTKQSCEIANKKRTLTWNFKIRPFLRRATKDVDILKEVTAAGHDEFITTFLCVAAGVKFYRQVNGSWDVHLILKAKDRCKMVF